MENEKKEAINTIMDDLNNYCAKNALLKINILPSEWNIFFDVLYDYILKKQLEGHYLGVLEVIVDNAISKSQFSHDNKFLLYLIKKDIAYRAKTTNQYFTINDIINSISILYVYNFKKEEINEIKGIIEEKCMLGEVVPIKKIKTLKKIDNE